MSDRAPWMGALDCTLRSVDLSLDLLRSSAEAVILFGSRAAGLGGPASDWDVLIVGRGQSRVRPALDLIYVAPEVVRSEAWLSSELAGHVAYYGRWIYGVPDWTRRVTTGVPAAAAKARRIRRQAEALERSCALISDAHRVRRTRAIRRDLQRYVILSSGGPVPPTPVLDVDWRVISDSRRRLEQLIRRVELPASVAALVIASAAPC